MTTKADTAEHNDRNTTMSVFVKAVRIAVGVGVALGSSLLVIMGGTVLYDLKLKTAVEKMATNEIVIYSRRIASVATPPGLMGRLARHLSPGNTSYS
jgi:hypothetical protein